MNYVFRKCLYTCNEAKIFRTELLLPESKDIKHRTNFVYVCGIFPKKYVEYNKQKIIVTLTPELYSLGNRKVNISCENKLIKNANPVVT